MALLPAAGLCAGPDWECRAVAGNWHCEDSGTPSPATPAHRPSTFVATAANSSDRAFPATAQTLPPVRRQPIRRPILLVQNDPPQASAGRETGAPPAGDGEGPCRAGRGGPPAVGLDHDHDASLPIMVSADAAVAEIGTEQIRFSGDVELVQGALQIGAQTLHYNRITGALDASGGFTLTRPDLRLNGDAAHYQLVAGHGTVEQVEYELPAIGARGNARHAEFDEQGLSRYREISYTTCKVDKADWLLTAEALELDHAEGLGTADHASLRLLGAPMLYLPTFSFPIDDRRRSGVLIPSVGYGGNTGIDVTVPYYFNLAENYDLTLSPRMMSDRGLMLGGELRFLTGRTEGELRADYLPYDDDFEGGNSARGSALFNSVTRFSDQLRGTLRLNYASDADYFSDLGGDLAATSATHLERTGELRYAGDDWMLIGRAQYYQTIDDAIAVENRPYSRLPQIRFDLERSAGPLGATYHLDAEYVNFHHRELVRGHRVDLTPAISFPSRSDGAYLEPKLGLRYTAYELSRRAAGLPNSPSTLSGLFRLDGGLFFERQARWFGVATQTLEPRAMYLFVPDRDQSEQPVFDTTTLNFGFDNLFRDNRFNGADRFGDANQLTLALTSRLRSDATGAELLRASIGQTLYFDDRKVVLPGESVDKDNSSSLAFELAAELGGHWRSRAGLQWDPHDGDDGTIDQALAQISYRDGRQRVFNAAYRLRNGITEQTDLAGYWPLGDRFSLIARHNYSLQENRLLEGLLGIEYRECCWRLRAVARRYTDGVGDDHNLAFMLQLELNGLGRLGDDIDSTLERGIYGYRTDEDD